MFEHIKVTFPEFNYYQQLNSKDKFLYVTELYELEKNKQDVNIEDVLNNFFNEHNSIDSEKKVDFDSFNVGNHKE